MTFESPKVNEFIKEVERKNGGPGEMSKFLAKIIPQPGMYEAFLSAMKLLTYSVSMGDITPEHAADIVTDLMKFILSPECQKQLDEMSEEVKGLTPSEVKTEIASRLSSIGRHLNIPQTVLSSAVGRDVIPEITEDDFLPSAKTVH